MPAIHATAFIPCCCACQAPIAGRRTIADDQPAFHQNVPDKQIGAGDPLEHRCQGCLPDFAARLADGGQRHGQQARVFHVVDAGDADAARDLDAELEQRAHELAGGAVIRADKPVDAFEQGPERPGIDGVQAVDGVAIERSRRLRGSPRGIRRCAHRRSGPRPNRRSWRHGARLGRASERRRCGRRGDCRSRRGRGGSGRGTV